MPRQTDIGTEIPTSDWAADDLESECMSDDDFEMDDVIDDDDSALLDDDDAPAPAGNVPVWRLIEMSRENRYLERELADFEDYDRFTDDFSGSYAH